MLLVFIGFLVALYFLLIKHKDTLKKIADALLEKETIDKNDLNEIAQNIIGSEEDLVL